MYGETCAHQQTTSTSITTQVKQTCMQPASASSAQLTKTLHMLDNTRKESLLLCTATMCKMHIPFEVHQKHFLALYMTAAVHSYSMVREPASIRACQLQHLHISYNHTQGTSKVSVEYSQHSLFSAKVALVYELNAPGCDCSALKDSLPHGFGSQLEGSRSVAGAKAGFSNGTRRRQTATRPQREGVAEVLTQQLRKRAYGISTVWAFYAQNNFRATSVK